MKLQLALIGTIIQYHKNYITRSYYSYLAINNSIRRKKNISSPTLDLRARRHSLLPPTATPRRRRHRVSIGVVVTPSLFMEVMQPLIPLICRSGGRIQPIPSIQHLSIIFFLRATLYLVFAEQSNT